MAIEVGLFSVHIRVPDVGGMLLFEWCEKKVGKVGKVRKVSTVVRVVVTGQIYCNRTAVVTRQIRRYRTDSL